MKAYPYVVVLKEPGTGKPWDCHVIAKSEAEAERKVRGRGKRGWRHIETRRFGS